jgi:polar amino acid transport system permease protein
VWQQLVDAAPLLFSGLRITVMYTVLGAVAAVVLAFVFGLMALSPRRAVRGVSRTIVEFFRGTSLVVQILWIYFALPFLGISLHTVAAATVALGLNFGAYGSEVVRGAIAAVPKTQWEATVALSLSRFERMRRVILPQAIPEMVPPFGNLLVQMLKGSSLLFLVGITELTFQVQDLRKDTGSLVAFGLGLVVYFILAQLFLALMRVWEARSSARVGRGRLAKRRSQSFVTEAPSGGFSGNGGV